MRGGGGGGRGKQRGRGCLDVNLIGRDRMGIVRAEEQLRTREAERDRVRKVYSVRP